MKPLRRLLRRVVLALAATALMIATATALFLTPPAVHLLLRLSDAPVALGVAPEVAEQLSDALVGDLLAAGSFGVPMNGAPLLSASERAHLVDVGALLRTVLIAGVCGLVLLCLAGWRRASWLRVAARDGGRLIAGGALAAAAAFALAFDATFTFFHRLFFADGTWTFNPATDRLVQLYPERFWILAAILFCASLALISLLAFRWSARYR